MNNILKRVNNSRGCRLSLTVISHASVVINVLAYAVLLVFSIVKEKDALPLIILGALIPFVLVTLARKIINAPRPYELYGFYEKRPKEKGGESFPSRHVFSSFVIATLALPFSYALALACFLSGIALSVCRVFLGIHFVRDVVAGALVGVLSGALSILIF